MDFLRTHYNSISTAVFVLAIVVAHIFSSQNYDWTKNTISDLGAQGYDRKIIMQFGFTAFGLILTAGIALNGLTWRTAPILIYGICVGLTGIFCTKPFFKFDNYSEIQSTIHALLAQIAGVAFTVGIVVQWHYTPNGTTKWAHILFFVLVLGLSVSFGLAKNHQGIIQRLLYLTGFTWLIKYYKL